MVDSLDFVLEEKPRRGVSIAVVVSLVLHALFITYIVKTYRPISSDQVITPMVHYVELIRQNILPDVLDIVLLRFMPPYMRVIVGLSIGLTSLGLAVYALNRSILAPFTRQGRLTSA